MAQLKNGKIYHYGEIIGTYKGARGHLYSAEIGWILGREYLLSMYDTKRELLAAIRDHLNR